MLTSEWIKEKAKEYQIEIVENKPLARMLYHNVELGEQVPQELYQAVAEVLAMVYHMQGRICHDLNKQARLCHSKQKIKT